MLQYLEFIGRFHPLLVHLPIGILVFAYFLLVLQRFYKINLEKTIKIGFLSGAIFSFFSSVTGWFLSKSGDYEKIIVTNHQWAGICTTAFAFFTYFFRNHRWLFSSILLVALFVTGYFGVTLTHGEGFLSDFIKSDQFDNKSLEIRQSKQLNSKKDSIKKVFEYRDKIVPILKKKCYNCHSSTKRKGGLRLDSEYYILKGGKNGKVLIEGNSSLSPLYTNLILPQEHDDHMPPKGKPQLSKQEIAILYSWIKKGASFKEEIEIINTNNSVYVTDNSSPVKFNIIDSLQIHNVLKKEDLSLEAKLFLSHNPPIPNKIMERFKQMDISISNLSTTSNLIEANFINVRNYNPNMINELKIIENQIIRIKLSHQPVEDRDVVLLSNFKNLNRLNLENTLISENALFILKELRNLEYLNLYNTNVSDKSIEDLINIPNLKVVFLWKTKISQNGFEKLKKSRPDLQIEMGNFNFLNSDLKKDSLKKQM